MFKKTGLSGHKTHKVPAGGKNKPSKMGLKMNKGGGPKKSSSLVHSRKVTKKAASPKKASTKMS